MISHPKCIVPALPLALLLLGAAWLPGVLPAAAAEAAPADSLGPGGGVAAGDTAGHAALQPTIERPWNPARNAAAEPWETVVDIPGRIVSFPFTALGRLTRHTLLAVEARNLVPRVTSLFTATPRVGFFGRPASLGDRTGFGAALVIEPPGLRRFMSAEVSGSTRHYSSTRAALFQGPARLEYGYDWRPEERFYGFGMESREQDTTSFASQSESLRLRLGWPPPRRGATPGTSASAWIGPRMRVVREGREQRVTPLEAGFPALASGLGQRREHLVYGLRLAADRRRGAPHWSSGSRASLEAERFDRPLESLALHSAAAPAAQFTRFTWALESGLSFLRDPRTLRLALRVIDQQVTSAPSAFLIADLASLGGGEGLSGFQPGRFRGLDAVVGRLSYLFPLEQYLELDLHAETGGVYADLHRASLESFEQSFGLALRPRSNHGILGSVGVDWSREAVRFRFALGGVE